MFLMLGFTKNYTILDIIIPIFRNALFVFKQLGLENLVDT